MKTVCFQDARAINRRHMLLTGWVAPTDAIVQHELLDSALRNRIDLSRLKVTVKKFVVVSDTAIADAIVPLVASAPVVFVSTPSLHACVPSF